MNKKGFIYVLRNPSFPHLVKIGKTKKTSEERAIQLYTTALPIEFVIEFEKEVSNCGLVEKLVHEKLKKRRPNLKREYFETTSQEAISVIERVIIDLEKQNKLEFLENYSEIPTVKSWWTELSIVWKQIFRNHLVLKYQPNEIDLLAAVHSVIDHCQNETLRAKVGKLISERRFTEKIMKWYNKDLINEKKLFNSYLPYELSETEVENILSLETINCSNNIAVIDLKPLKMLTNIKILNCVNTSILDLQPLKTLTKLEEINLNFTKIDSLKYLESLPNLKKVNCHDTMLSYEEIVNFNRIKPLCEVETKIFLTSDIPKKSIK